MWIMLASAAAGVAGIIEPEWLDYVAAFSGPVAGVIAIGIALYNNNQTQTRFTKQLAQEQELDEKADRRQQAEWNRREQERRWEREEFEKRLSDSLKRELYIIAKAATNVRNDLGEAKPSMSHRWNPPKGFTLMRPVYESLGTEVVRMPEDILSAIATHEPILKRAFDQLRGRENRDVASEYLIGAIDEILRACHEYLAELESNFGAGFVFTPGDIEERVAGIIKNEAEWDRAAGQ